jgi:hypothetical protein
MCRNLEAFGIHNVKAEADVLLHSSVCTLEAHLLLAAGRRQDGLSTRFLKIIELERSIEIFLFIQSLLTTGFANIFAYSFIISSALARCSGGILAIASGGSWPLISVVLVVSQSPGLRLSGWKISAAEIAGQHSKVNASESLVIMSLSSG